MFTDLAWDFARIFLIYLAVVFASGALFVAGAWLFVHLIG